MVMFFFVFFFKQKTAYEMRISDWSSDVCSSDLFDLQGNILTANDLFLNTLGYTMAELKGRHHSTFVDVAHRSSPEYREFWEKLGRGEYDAGQYRRIRKDGSDVWIQASYNPICDEMGRPCKVVRSEEHTSELQSLMLIS